MATVGTATLVMITVSAEGAQVPLLIVQWNVLAPAPRPVTVLVGLVGVVIVPLPPAKVQTPLPLTAVLPAKVALGPHSV